MEKNKDDLVAVQPVLREFTPAFGYKQYGVPYHPGALKFFKEQNLTPQPLGLNGAAAFDDVSKQGDVIMTALQSIVSARIARRSLAAAIARPRRPGRLGADLRARHHAARHAGATRLRPPSPRR